MARLVGPGGAGIPGLAGGGGPEGPHVPVGRKHLPADVRHVGGGPGFSEEEGASLTGLAAVPKVVFSSTLQGPLGWPNSKLVSGDAVEAVGEMKGKGSGPLSTLGSLSLCRSLLAAGLVDRFRLVVFPVITGRTGRERIYDGYPDVALEMVDSRTFDGRLQLLEYIPTILDGPPGSANLPTA